LRRELFRVNGIALRHLPNERNKVSEELVRLVRARLRRRGNRGNRLKAEEGEIMVVLGEKLFPVPFRITLS
jgi:hypothetical protein